MPSRGMASASLVALVVHWTLLCGATHSGEVTSSVARGDRLETFQVKDCTGPASGKTLVITAVMAYVLSRRSSCANGPTR